MSDLRLTELLKVLEASAVREQRHLDDQRRAVLRQYKQVNLQAAVKELRAALDAPTPASARARTDLALRALDIAVRELKVPPKRAEQIIRQAVRDRVQTVDELARLQDPRLSFNDPAQLQARAVSKARADMNGYWEKETKRFRDDVSRVMRQSIQQKLSPEKAAEVLQVRLGVSRSRAVLIVSDQTLTAAANADRQRQRDMGIETYLWRTQEDSRVRPEHRARDGKRFKWNEGGEFPGQAILCRCRAVPILLLPRAARS